MDKTELNITMTQRAQDQIQLMIDNDYTIEGFSFRLKIDGKGCNGFDYALGFTEKEKDDIEYSIQDSQIKLAIDPFTAHYCAQGHIDFLVDLESDTEGFIFENPNEKDYHGKFFKDEEMLPKI